MSEINTLGAADQGRTEIDDDELRAMQDIHGHGSNGGCELPLMRAVADAAVRRALPQWIPCAERLPGTEQPVLIRMPVWGNWEWRIACVDEYGRWRDRSDGDDIEPDEVAYWMPLFALPPEDDAGFRRAVWRPGYKAPAKRAD